MVVHLFNLSNHSAEVGDLDEFKASQGRGLRRRHCLKTKARQHVEVSFEIFLLPAAGEKEVRKRTGGRGAVLPSKRPKYTAGPGKEALSPESGASVYLNSTRGSGTQEPEEADGELERGPKAGWKSALCLLTGVQVSVKGEPPETDHEGWGPLFFPQTFGLC